MGIEIRSIRSKDVPTVVAMVHELAEFERAPDECQLTTGQLHAALFGENPVLFGHVALVDGEPEPVGCALWFRNFSTWCGVPGIYLEDLYVRPAVRGAGVGHALLATLAKLCVHRGYARLDWWVLQWNPARDFYHAIGALSMDMWMPYRLSGQPLVTLAAMCPPAVAHAIESQQEDAM